jgi:hypothetical protein
MKEIKIDKINSYSKFITRGMKNAKLIAYVPEANEKNRLIFMVQGNILHTDERGKCYTVNGYDSDFSGSDFRTYDVYVDDVQIGWVNIYIVPTLKKNVVAECSPQVFDSYESAKKNAANNVLSTVKIEWVIEDESKNS